ncbi:hypothetical protein ACGF3J_35365 [Streptomyces sp. NPDC048171]|uniref:hypothetical protein n=1 Tax=Streptomyces sp. NPDC048171 TaxID=3365504 RepID=UPI00371CEC35
MTVVDRLRAAAALGRAGRVEPGSLTARWAGGAQGVALLLLPFPLVWSERCASGEFTEKPAGGCFLPQHLARHLGDLDAAQRVFWFTQTHTGRPGARSMRPSPLSRLLRRQQTQPDTGDTVARSVQSMFSGDWCMEDDLRAFLLSLLVTR